MKKTLIVIAAATVLPLAAIAGEGKDHSGSMGPSFNTLDANRDGRISQAEAASETLRVVDLFQQAVDLSRPRWKDQAQAQGAPVQVFVGAVDPALSVSGNGTELREVLTNMIINAVDAMPAGGRVTLDAERREGRAVLRVSDTGDGMDEATLRRIFEPFFTTRGPQNSGLGLAVSYGIVRRHGSRTVRLLGNARTSADLGRYFGGGLTEAEIRYLGAEEWAMTGADVLWRRTKCGLHMTPAEREAVTAFMQQDR